MDMVALGALSAFSLGSADFIARFTSLRYGAAGSLLGVLVLSTLALSALLAFQDFPPQWPLGPAWLLVGYGVATAVATLLLYEALARGPVTIAAPIVAAHPALVVASATMLGEPSAPIQWMAVAATIGGAVIAARYSGEPPDRHATGSVRSTIAIASAACVCYAALVVFGQQATPIYGGQQTVWFGRIVAVLTLIPLLLILRTPERGRHASGTAMLSLLILQSLLDVGGHILLFAGSLGAQPHIVAVVASCFGAVTTLLGYLILREHVSPPQWAGIGLVFAGVVVLSVATPS